MSDVSVRFIQSPPAALLCGGSIRTEAVRECWLAIVIPTLAEDISRRLPRQRLGVAVSALLTPQEPTRRSAVESLRDWAKKSRYEHVDVLLMAEPMTDQQRNWIAALNAAAACGR
jgi:hypothetical protein